MATSTISSSSFYGEYYGHKVNHLQTLLPRLRDSSESIIWTAGDSSLDNKYWFHDHDRAVGAYEDVLRPPVSICDVTYWLNFLNAHAQKKRSAINAAVEASTLNSRSFRLHPQDRFLVDNIEADDILIVSVGGNDVALSPLPCTIASLSCLVYCVPTCCIEHSCTCGAVPMDDTCCGFGPSLLSCLCSFPPCLGYFRHFFGTRVQKYVERLTSTTKPKKVLVCTIYYPDEASTPSWANTALKVLGYDTNPAKVQTLIRKLYSHGTRYDDLSQDSFFCDIDGMFRQLILYTVISTIRIPGTEVIHVPLFHALDGKKSEEYVARVEPSALGGRKMAELLLDMIDRQSPTPVSMADR